ncbi:hypothetical protein, partial [Micromonospora qiuiae]|uniref:hypothetical protein n=1 Tax=Micromonospora qiuiae TaxID=502268 RepID=UPI00194E0072
SNVVALQELLTAQGASVSLARIKAALAARHSKEKASTAVHHLHDWLKRNFGAGVSGKVFREDDGWALRDPNFPREMVGPYLLESSLSWRPTGDGVEVGVPPRDGREQVVILEPMTFGVLLVFVESRGEQLTWQDVRRSSQRLIPAYRLSFDAGRTAVEGLIQELDAMLGAGWLATNELRTHWWMRDPLWERSTDRSATPALVLPAEAEHPSVSAPYGRASADGPPVVAGDGRQLLDFFDVPRPHSLPVPVGSTISGQPLQSSRSDDLLSGDGDSLFDGDGRLSGDGDSLFDGDGRLSGDDDSLFDGDGRLSGDGTVSDDMPGIEEEAAPVAPQPPIDLAATFGGSNFDGDDFAPGGEGLQLDGADLTAWWHSEGFFAAGLADGSWDPMQIDHQSMELAGSPSMDMDHRQGLDLGQIPFDIRLIVNDVVAQPDSAGVWADLIEMDMPTADREAHAVMVRATGFALGDQQGDGERAQRLLDALPPVSNEFREQWVNWLEGIRPAPAAPVADLIDRLRATGSRQGGQVG